MREMTTMVLHYCPDCAAGDIVPDEKGNCTNCGYNLAQDTSRTSETSPLSPGDLREKNHILMRMLLGILAPVPIASVLFAAGTQSAGSQSFSVSAFMELYGFHLLGGVWLAGLSSIAYAIIFELICSKFLINRHVLLFIFISALVMALCCIHVATFLSFPLVLFTGIAVGLVLWPFRNRKKHNIGID